MYSMETMLYSLNSTKDLGLKTVWEHKEDVSHADISKRVQEFRRVSVSAIWMHCMYDITDTVFQDSHDTVAKDVMRKRSMVLPLSLAADLSQWPFAVMQCKDFLWPTKHFPYAPPL